LSYPEIGLICGSAGFFSGKREYGSKEANTTMTKQQDKDFGPVEVSNSFKKIKRGINDQNRRR